MQRDADSGVTADVKDSSDTLGLPLILIVEDDSYWLEHLERRLQSPHYGIHKTRKVGEALVLVRKNKYALILLDWRMPGIDGPGILEAVQKTDPEVPTIVLSAYGDAGQRSRALKLGARDFIDKPQKKKQWDALKCKVSDAVSSKPSDMDKPT